MFTRAVGLNGSLKPEEARLSSVLRTLENVSAPFLKFTVHLCLSKESDFSIPIYKLKFVS